MAKVVYIFTKMGFKLVEFSYLIKMDRLFKELRDREEGVIASMNPPVLDKTSEILAKLDEILNEVRKSEDFELVSCEGEDSSELLMSFNTSTTEKSNTLDVQDLIMDIGAISGLMWTVFFLFLPIFAGESFFCEKSIMCVM